MDTFNRLLDEYKNQYLQFLSTGDESYRTAYTRAMEAIEREISTKREAVDADKETMKQFAASYKKTNEELADTLMSAQGAQEQHDAFVTSKKRSSSWTYTTSPDDASFGYEVLLRVGIFLILLSVLLFVVYISGHSVSSTVSPYAPSYLRG
jgi:hypothetical protein